MKKVLLVEDDNKISLAMGIRLKSMGYDVDTAADAVQAMQRARSHNPDVVLIDINLPGGDGFTVAERLNNYVQTAGIPMIFITASKKESLRERAYEAGAAGFLEKPFQATDLADAIEASLLSGSPTPVANGTA